MCDAAGLLYIDPMGDLLEIIENIRRSKYVIAESLHGAIFADYYRVPWTPVSASRDFLPFKWLDWAQSAEIPIDIANIPHSDFLETVYNGASVRKPDYGLPLLNLTNQLAKPVIETRSRDSSICLLYTSPSPRDLSTSRMPSSA